MNKISIILTAFLLSLTVNAATYDSKHNWNNSTSSAMPASTAIIKSAKAEYKKALKLSFAWRDTAKMIKKAEKLAKKGKMSAAIKLANKAKNQAINGQKQAEVAKTAGPLF